MTDLSGQQDIVEAIDALFNSEEEDTKTAASLCLGKISLGNLDFFLPIVLKLVE